MRTQWTLRDNWFVRELASRTDTAGLLHELDALPEAELADRGWMTTTAPAGVHDVLLAHGRISDPRIGRNAADCAWIGERDWAFACRFATPRDLGNAAILRLLGLDVLATVYLNGKDIASCNDMFLRYSIEVTDRLRPPGEDNSLVIVFASPLQAIAQIQQPADQQGIVRPAKALRKTFNDFSSYLGARPHSVRVGICGEVLLDLTDRAWIEDVCVRTQLSTDHDRATVEVSVETGGDEATFDWRLLDAEGIVIGHGVDASPAETLRISIDGPQLWWPHTHGQPLQYQLDMTLKSGESVCDARRQRFGIRSVALQTTSPETGEPLFRFIINGRPLFLQGAGICPIEGMSHRPQPERTRGLIDLAEAAHMNLLRVWGGGDIPGDDFYDLCDERGILVWQDFMFGYGTYPDQDAAMMGTIRQEAEDVIRRLRNHPSLLLWVGGNENYMGYNFQFGGEPPFGQGIFEGVLPAACHNLDPTRPYHPSSPFGGEPPNWPLSGDWHDYTTVTYSHQASVPLFASEIGRASAPSYDSMCRFLSDDELWPQAHDARVIKPGQAAWPPMWAYRAADGAWEKTGAIASFCEPTDARELIRALGTAHGEYLQDRVERERRGRPDGAPPGERRCWGNMVWRLNDAWPTVYWSVIDYYLEAKIAYDFLRRAQAPVLLSFEKTADELQVWVTNDSTKSVRGELTVQRIDWKGRVKGRVAVEVAIMPGESKRCLDTVALGPIPLRQEFLLAQLGELRATHLLIGERSLQLPEAKVDAVAVEGGVTITTDHFARQVTLEMPGQPGALFGDNHFDLAPGEMRSVAISIGSRGGELVVRCLNAPTLLVRLL